MKFSVTSVRAALALACLSRPARPGLTHTRDVADCLRVPVDSAAKVLRALARRGLVESQLGRSGGYQLGRPADQINLLMVVEAVDGPITAEFPCGPGDDGPGGRLLRALCEQVAADVRRRLESVTVADLAEAGLPPPT